MLGCKSNRIENMKKLARSCAYRLGKEFLEKEAAQLKLLTKKQEENQNKFNLKKGGPRRISNINNTPVMPQANNGLIKKKIDNVNTEFIRYIEEREEKKNGKESMPPTQNRD